MTTTVIRIGNSNGLLIPAKILKRLSISERDILEIKECDGGIMLKKADMSPLRTPFSPLDDWKEENGYADESLSDALEYVENIRKSRANREIKLW